MIRLVNRTGSWSVLPTPPREQAVGREEVCLAGPIPIQEGYAASGVAGEVDDFQLTGANLHPVSILDQLIRARWDFRRIQGGSHRPCAGRGHHCVQGLPVVVMRELSRPLTGPRCR